MVSTPRCVLVSNDDGPPSKESPFISPFLTKMDSLLKWKRLVCVPAAQQSWVSKAMFKSKPAELSYARVEGDRVTEIADTEATSSDWALVSGSPATCTNVALYGKAVFPGHSTSVVDEVDYVLSGPNYGNNLGRGFSSSSGTVGAAFETALHQKRSVAISFAFFNGPSGITAEQTANACAVSARVAEYLWNNWDEGVWLYNVNLPVDIDVSQGSCTLAYTYVLQDTYGAVWHDAGEKSESGKRVFTHKTTELVMHGKAETPPEGSDWWAVRNGYVSITPLTMDHTHARMRACEPATQHAVGDTVSLTLNL
eukprot:GFYU01012201.1.p1 GENE.GFYU01012201.1~~GFYU01012201.1.p1  ORF type:complete len:310 (-),score=63.63 GFYU01012201.1:467-1396(-)